MKKLIILSSLLGLMGISSAEYTLKYPLEANQGGSLPNGSLNIIKKGQTTPYTYDCIIPKVGMGTNVNAKCENGIFYVYLSRGYIGTCSAEDYYFKVGPAEYSGTCPPL